MKDFLVVVVILQNIVIRRRHQEGGGNFHREEGWLFSLSIQPSCHLAILPWDMRMGTDGCSD